MRQVYLKGFFEVDESSNELTEKLVLKVDYLEEIALLFWKQTTKSMR